MNTMNNRLSIICKQPKLGDGIFTDTDFPSDNKSLGQYPHLRSLKNK